MNFLRSVDHAVMRIHAHANSCTHSLYKYMYCRSRGTSGGETSADVRPCWVALVAHVVKKQAPRHFFGTFTQILDNMLKYSPVSQLTRFRGTHHACPRAHSPSRLIDDNTRCEPHSGFGGGLGERGVPVHAQTEPDAMDTKTTTGTTPTPVQARRAAQSHGSPTARPNLAEREGGKMMTSC